MAEKKDSGEGQDKRTGWREQILREVFDEEKLDIMRMSEISIILKDYSDIFSDFDPRPYAQRSLSDDFLIEAKKACKVKATESPDVKFLVPEGIRKQNSETMIKKRLHEFFKKHHELMKGEIRETQFKGIKLTAIGFGLLLVASVFKVEELKHPLSLDNIYIIATTFLEPAGWFTMWTGLDHFFYVWRSKKEDFEFYEKMSRAKISFISY